MNSQLKNKYFFQKMRSYFIGFLFSLLLTIIPFTLVIKKKIKSHFIFLILFFCACIQIIVQIKYFLHLKFSKNNYWIIFFLLFSIIIIFIVLFGSIWIMYNLNHHCIF